VDLLLIDECHNVNPAESGMYRTLIADLKRYGSAHLRVIGWTGTPFRGNGVWLQQGDAPLFTAVAATVGMPELLRQGHLSPLVTAKTETRIDTTGVGISNGDYKIGELEARAEEVTDAAIEELVRLGADRKQWLVFCVTIEHAEGVLAALTMKGIDADMVTGKTASAKRNDMINRFKAGQLRCLVNVACLTTGFDAPETDLIALLRPTKSPVLYVQIAGRGMRTAPGKTDCLWLDFTSTTADLGAVDTIRGRNKRVPKEGDSKEKKAPVKLCDGCGNEVPAGVLVCPDCGHEFPQPAPSVNRTASNATILASMAAPEPIRISNITYRRHSKEGSPDSLRVDYWDGYKVAASEWVCIEHHGYARQKAQLWWERRTCYPFPRTVTDALEITGGLRRPSSITIVKNGKFQEIRGYDFARVAEPEADAGNGDGLDDEGAGAAAGAGLCQLRLPGEERELFPLESEAAAACAE
jgi:DNA repair protein RadD